MQNDIKDTIREAIRLRNSILRRYKISWVVFSALVMFIAPMMLFAWLPDGHYFVTAINLTVIVHMGISLRRISISLEGLEGAIALMRNMLKSY